MQELEFVTMMVIMISCAYTSYQLGRKEGIRNAILYFEDEGSNETSSITDGVLQVPASAGGGLDVNSLLCNED